MLCVYTLCVAVLCGCSAKREHWPTQPEKRREEKRREEKSYHPLCQQLWLGKAEGGAVWECGVIAHVHRV